MFDDERMMCGTGVLVCRRASTGRTESRALTSALGTGVLVTSAHLTLRVQGRTLAGESAPDD